MLPKIKLPKSQKIRLLIVAIAIFAGFSGQVRAETAEPWEVVCTVADAWVAQPNRDANTDLERETETWIGRRVQRFEHRLAILFMPACQTVDAALPGMAEMAANSLTVAPGAILNYVYSDPKGEIHAPVYRLNGEEWSEIASGRGAGMLAADGLSVAGLKHERNDGKILIKNYMSSEITTIQFHVPPARQIWAMFLQSYDPFLNRAVIVWDVNHLFNIDLDSGEATELGRPEIWLGGKNLRLVPGGWVAWDYTVTRLGDRDDIKWALPWSMGGFTFDAGDEITAAAVSPSGRNVAVSVRREHAGGGYESELFVIRTSSGAVIHRRIIWSVDPPRIPGAQDEHTPIPDGALSFLGEDYLAVSIGQGDRIDVLRVPAK